MLALAKRLTVPVPVETLFDLADAHGVCVEWYPDPRCPRGEYMVVDREPVILLSPKLKDSPMRLRCALAHELGHHFAGSFWERVGGEMRDERRADRWAQDLLLPLSWLGERLWMAAGELADEAGVYQRWVEARLRRLAETAFASA